MSKKTNSRAIALMSLVALSAATFTAASAQTSGSCSYVFTQTMRTGSKGAEVMNLQKVLNMSAATAVATSGAGSAGNETMNFGPATRAAVMKYQAANGISPVSGLVGPLTRAKLNTVCTGTGVVGGNTTGSTTTTTQSGPVTMSLTGSQPTTAVVAGQAGAVLANFTLSGNGTVQNMVFTRTGVSANDALQNVYLYEGANRLTDAASVSSDNMIRFNNANIAVNGSRTITVRADIATTTQLTTVVGQIVGVAASSMTLAGNTTPVTMSLQGSNLVVAGAATAGAKISATNTVNANTNLTVPQTNYTVWGTNLEVSTRSVKLNGMTLKMIGSAPVSAVANVGLVVDGARVATATADANGRFVFDLSKSPVALTTGSHTVEARADIVGGASRNFYFTLENAADLMVEDSNLPGVNVNVERATVTAAKNAGTQTISSATNSSVAIATDSAFVTSSVVAGATNQTIAQFKFTAYGEDTKVQYITIAPSLELQNVALFVNGAQVGSTNNTGALTQQFSLGSQFVATAGQAYTIEVKADLSNKAGVNYTTGNVKADLKEVIGQGMSSQNTFTYSNTVTGRTIAVGGNVVNFGKTLGAVATYVSKNSNNVKIGSFQLQAGSIEDVDVTQLTLALAVTGSTTLNSISNVRITDASTPVGVPSATNNFSVAYRLAKGTTRTIEVTADLGEIGTVGSIKPTLTVGYRGVSSNISATTAAKDGDTLTVATVEVGTPTASKKTSSQYTLGGKTQEVATFNITAANGTATLNDLVFTVNGTGVQSLSINGREAQVIGATSTFTGVDITVPQGSQGVNIPVLVTYSPVATQMGQGGVSSGATSSVSLASIKTTASGVVATTAITGVKTNDMTLVSTLPTVTKVANSGSSVGTSGGVAVKLGSIKVSADSAGAIKIGKVSYAIAAPASVSNVIAKINGAVAQDNAGANATTTATDVTFASGYRVDAGTSITIDIFGTVASGATNSSMTDVSVGTPSEFKWTDSLEANAAFSLTGTQLSSTNYVQ